MTGRAFCWLKVTSLSLLLSASSAVAKPKVLIDAPPKLKALLEKPLKRVYLTEAKNLSPEPAPAEVKQACAAEAAIAVVTGRLQSGYYTVVVRNAADGQELSSFRFKAPAGKKPLKALPKVLPRQLIDALSDARPAKKDTAAPTKEPEVAVVKPKAAPEGDDDEQPAPKEKPKPKPKIIEVESTDDDDSAQASDESDSTDDEVRPQALRIAVGFGGMSRRYYFTDDIFGQLASYNIPFGRSLRFELDLYPAAFFTSSFAANIGLVSSLEIPVAVTSNRIDPNDRTTVLSSYGTSAMRLRISATARIPLWRLSIQPLVGYSRQSYAITPDANGEKPALPDVAYSGLRLGGTVRLQIISMVAVQLTIAGQFLLGLGEVGSANYFPRARGSAFDMQLAVPVSFGRYFEARLHAGYDRYWLSMNPEPADVPPGKVAGGALDDYFNAGVSLAFTY